VKGLNNDGLAALLKRATEAHHALQAVQGNLTKRQREVKAAHKARITQGLTPLKASTTGSTKAELQGMADDATPSLPNT
jgi:hypothetical protein